MPLEPISYVTTRDFLLADREQEPHPLMRLILSQVLMGVLTSPTEEAARATVHALLGLVLDTCERLAQELRERHPCIPPDPQEQEQMWQEATMELLSRWHYQNVTAQVRDWNERDTQAKGRRSHFHARLVLRSPETISYIHTLSDLLITLDDARQAESTRHPQEEPEAPQEEEDDAPRL